MTIPNNYLRCIHRTGQAKPNPKCPRCKGAGVIRDGTFTLRCGTCFPPVPVAAPSAPVAVPMEQKPGKAPAFIQLRITGQVRGGKNNMGVTKTGKHFPRPKWAAWRNIAVREILGQLPSGWMSIKVPVSVHLYYVAGDKRRRDQPAILDAIWHVLEKAGVVLDDTLLWVTESTREQGTKETARALITIAMP